MTPIISSHPITSETGDPNHAGTSIFETFCIASTTAAESIFFILPSAVWLLFFRQVPGFHSPVFAFSSQFLLQIPSSFDILHSQRRFPGKSPGECLRTARCDGSADAVEQRTLAEDIEVEGIKDAADSDSNRPSRKARNPPPKP